MVQDSGETRNLIEVLFPGEVRNYVEHWLQALKKGNKQLLLLASRKPRVLNKPIGG